MPGSGTEIPLSLPGILALTLLEGGIKCHLARRKVHALYKCSGLCRSMLTIHPAIFPLDRERPIVANPCECSEHLLPGYPTPTRRDKVPPTSWIPKVKVRAQNSIAAIQVAHAFLNMDMIDPVGKGLNEEAGINELVIEMAWVKVNPEPRPMPNRLKRLLGRWNVVGNFGRMDLQPEAYAHFVEHVDDRIPSVGKLAVSCLNHPGDLRGKEVEHVPDWGSREAIHLLDAERRRRPSSILDLLSGTLSNALGITIAPDTWRQDAFVTLVDNFVGDCLADKMVGDRKVL